MFENVTVNHFRTFEKATLDDLGKTTALIGRNAAGKSNLLHALDVLGRLASEPDGTRGISISKLFNAWGELPTFVAVITLPEGLYRYSVAQGRALVRSPTSKHAHTQLSLIEHLDWAAPESPVETKRIFTRHLESITLPGVSDGIRTGYSTPTLVALSSLLPADSPVRVLTDPLRRFLGRVRYYALDEPARGDDEIVVRGDSYNEWVNEYRRTGVLGNPVSLQVLHLALTADDRFAELKDRLGRKGLRLLSDITVRPLPVDEPTAPHLDPNTGLLDPNAFYSVLFHLPRSNQELDTDRWFGQLSQGTRRLVRLLTAMAYGDNSVMLIEHPEDGIHRGLLKKVMGLFTTGFCPSQLFLSTHSDTVLNGLEPEAIRFVSAEDGKSTVRKMTPAELAAAGEYIDSDAEGTLAEFAHSIED